MGLPFSPLNQINNSLAFPSVFRGMLEVRASCVNDEMLIAAAKAIANWVESQLSVNKIVPTMEDIGVFIETALAVANAAIETDVARCESPNDELRNSVEQKILRIKRVINVLVEGRLL